MLLYKMSIVFHHGEVAHFYRDNTIYRPYNGWAFMCSILLFSKDFWLGCHEYFLTKHKQKINNQMKRTVFIAVAILLLSIGWYWRHHAQQTQQKKLLLPLLVYPQALSSNAM
ncbi:MAG: hypothetical protein HWD59_11515 [Coxiellaceae bacterium]|nr:MAG: hypothetical protein HWD59_11515 [Coxiellaceae bacterium]